MGRPTKREVINRHISEAMSKLTPEAIAKLEQIYSLDASRMEICHYLDISYQTLLNWREKNPDLFAKLERLKSRPVLKARMAVVNALNEPNMAFKYLERKLPDEFGQKQGSPGMEVSLEALLTKDVVAIKGQARHMLEQKTDGDI